MGCTLAHAHTQFLFSAMGCMRACTHTHTHTHTQTHKHTHKSKHTFMRTHMHALTHRAGIALTSTPSAVMGRRPAFIIVKLPLASRLRYAWRRLTFVVPSQLRSTSTSPLASAAWQGKGAGERKRRLGIAVRGSIHFNVCIHSFIHSFIHSRPPCVIMSTLCIHVHLACVRGGYRTKTHVPHAAVKCHRAHCKGMPCLHTKAQLAHQGRCYIFWSGGAAAWVHIESTWRLPCLLTTAAKSRTKHMFCGTALCSTAKRLLRRVHNTRNRSCAIAPGLDEQHPEGTLKRSPGQSCPEAGIMD